MSGRVYIRKFDWDEAVRLRKQGMLLREIAARLGVSESAVDHAVNPRSRARAAAITSEYQRGGTCIDCGKQCSRNYSVHTPRRCHSCAARALVTAVRDDGLLCFRCKEWKWDTEFPYSRAKRNEVRRGRHSFCRGCQTIARREYRNRNKVPCSNGCGELVLAEGERTGLCRRCWHATRRRAA